MNRYDWIKPLVRKEWIQNRLLFIAAFLLLSSHPTLTGLLYWIGFAYEERTSAGWANALEEMLLHNAGSTFTLLGFYLIPTIAIRLLGDERREQTLEFLVALPIGRTQIALAKYLAGFLFLWATLIVNMLFVVMMTALIPAQYQLADVFRWFFTSGMVLTAMYSLGFLAAVVTGRRITAYLLTALLLFLPKILFTLVLNVWWSDAERTAAQQFNDWTDRFSLPYYLFQTSNFVRNGTDLWVFFGMLALSALLLLLSLSLFRRNQLERNGYSLIFSVK